MHWIVLNSDLTYQIGKQTTTMKSAIGNISNLRQWQGSIKD